MKYYFSIVFCLLLAVILGANLPPLNKGVVSRLVALEEFPIALAGTVCSPPKDAKRVESSKWTAKFFRQDAEKGKDYIEWVNVESKLIQPDSIIVITPFTGDRERRRGRRRFASITHQQQGMFEVMMERADGGTSMTPFNFVVINEKKADK